MPEIITIEYPGALDTASSLLGSVGNRETYRLSDSMAVDSLVATFQEDLSGLSLPNYIVFEGGEIWWVEEGQIGGVGNNIITLSLFSQRGVSGSPVQPHALNERVYVTFLEKHHDLYQQATIAIQKYNFVLGLDAAKPATCSPGQGYISTDTSIIYLCYTTNNWTQLEAGNHSSLTGLADDDHTQYQKDSDAGTWHGSESGDHIQSGDDHDHTTTNEGPAILRVAGGLLTNRPTPSIVGEVYFARDVDNGTFYISYDAATWSPLFGVPSGGIAPFNTACPTGWTRYTDLDEAFPQADSVVVALSGVDSHVHTYLEIVEHDHNIWGASPTSSNNGDHTHTVQKGDSSGGGLNPLEDSSGNSSLGTTSDGNHGHSGSAGATVTASDGEVSPETETESNLPPYQEVVFCKKD